MHAANISYAFSTRMKNLALVVGLGLCLGLDINSFAIWQSLYSDQQLRTTFASTYAKAALESSEQGEPKQPAAGPSGSAAPAGNEAGSAPSASEQEKQRLNENTKEFMNKLASFQKDVSFGVGRVWQQPQKTGAALWQSTATEFFGSLMTGILISIGAAYWHDLLRSLTSLRQPSTS